MKIIDVREKSEYESGHIEGALNISLAEIMNGELPKCDKDEPIILYCVSGGRADKAKAILESAGYLKVENGGGYYDMKTKGY